jgi:alkylation response protein AidB-like acyl-CoA dehydrogenase
MKFDLDDEQYEFADVLDKALSERGGAPAVRAAWEEAGAGYGPVRATLAQLGVQGLTAPGSCGGSDLALSDCMLVLESFGRHLVPDDIALTLGVVVPVLAAHLDDRAVADLLPGLADGTLTASVQDGWAGWSPTGADVDLVLVLNDGEAALCRPDAGDTERTNAFGRGRLLGRVGKGARRVASFSGPEAESARARASIVTAAALSGVASAMVAMAAEYAKERRQFGRVIGSFQAVKHQLADAAVGVETARRTAWWAAVCLESNIDDLAEAVAVAKGTIGQATSRASYASLQVHGGIGYTWECDLHLWMKRAQALEADWGHTDQQWRRLAEIYAAQGHANTR